MNEPQLRAHSWTSVVVTALVILGLLTMVVVGVGRTLGLFL